MYELAFMLGVTREHLENLSYQEIIGWQEYFRRRPFGWREDNRAATIAMSMGGGKMKPEDLFYSLKILKEDTGQKKEEDLAVSLFTRLAANSSNPELAASLLERND